MEFVTLPLWIGKNHCEGIDTFDIGVQCVQRLAKRLALHLAEFSPSIVGRSLGFVAVKKFAKNLEMMTTTINGPRGEFNFIFHSAKSQGRYLLVPLRLVFTSDGVVVGVVVRSVEFSFSSVQFFTIAHY